jgi:hypothetical protein
LAALQVDYLSQGGRSASASVEPGIPDVELTLELVPGLLDSTVFDADPVVLVEPRGVLLNRTVPFESRQ